LYFFGLLFKLYQSGYTPRGTLHDELGFLGASQISSFFFLREGYVELHYPTRSSETGVYIDMADPTKENTEDKKATEQSIVSNPPAKKHPLKYEYTFHFLRRQTSGARFQDNYEQSVKEIGSFGTVRITDRKQTVQF
jgi:hypothetical protein